MDSEWSCFRGHLREYTWARGEAEEKILKPALLSWNTSDAGCLIKGGLLDQWFSKWGP